MAEEIDLGELPWFTEEEIEGVGREFEKFYAENPSLISMHDLEAAYEAAYAYTGSNINWIYYKRDVLNKYRNNPYIDIDIDDGHGYEYIRFLSVDNKKPPDSRVSFMTSTSNLMRMMNGKAGYVNVPEDPSIIMFKTEDYTAIPPRQRSHWDKYRISDNEIKKYIHNKEERRQ